MTFAKDIELVLRMQERVSMEKLAASVTDVDSPRYGKFYSPEEIRDIAGPLDSTYSQSVQTLKAKGFKIVGEDKTHLFVTIRASQAVVEKAFGTKLQFTDKEKAFHRALQTPQIPRELNVIHSIIGLDNQRHSRPMHQTPLLQTRGSIDDPNTGILPDAIKNIYGFDPIYKAGVTGVGQQIAIATYDNFHPADVTWFWGIRDITPVPQLDEVYFNGVPAVNDDSCSETELDAEFSGMIATGAQIHVFPSAHNDDSGEVQLFTAILNDNRAKVVNYSWGDCEANVTAQHFSDMNQVFARAVAQGVNIMVASGDSGSYGCSEDNTITKPGKVNAGWPAADPYVVSVGGTTITGGGLTNSIAEWTWDGSGGGISTIFSLPSWQQNLGAPFAMRSFPDVAFNADPETGETAFVHYQNQQRWLQFGGTSIAAPQWTGFLTLVNQARGAKGAVGYLNPIIYGMSAELKAQTFNDVTKGNNGAYKAKVGWDATTGWGSMRASDLFNFLKGN